MTRGCGPKTKTNSVYWEGTNARTKVPSPERVGMNVVVMAVAAASLPPGLQFGSRLSCLPQPFLGFPWPRCGVQEGPAI